MKPYLLFFFLFAFTKTYSQDSIQIKRIDSLVQLINHSDYPLQLDTIVQDRPEFGLKTTSYLTMIVVEKQLLKYVNFVNSEMTINGEEPSIRSSCNTFYYHQNQLIKVEEFAILEDKKIELEWYYAEGQAIYNNTLPPEKSEARANLLLSMANAMVKQVVK